MLCYPQANVPKRPKKPPATKTLKKFGSINQHGNDGNDDINDDENGDDKEIDYNDDGDGEHDVNDDKNIYELKQQYHFVSSVNLEELLWIYDMFMTIPASLCAADIH